ncbi:MAG: hypothetical protein AB7S93_11665 [Xanthobacteraceae bacterium]
MLLVRHRRGLPRRVLAAWTLLAAVVVLTGCASTIGESLPSAVGGLPENAPQRPETPPAYPSVHDRPPERTNTVLSGKEQKRLEDELAAARNKAGAGTNRNP